MRKTLPVNLLFRLDILLLRLDILLLRLQTLLITPQALENKRKFLPELIELIEQEDATRFLVNILE